MTFKGRVHCGKLEMLDEYAFGDGVRSFEGKRIVLELREDKPRRSPNQNSYLFGAVLPTISEALGYADNDITELWAWVKMEVGHVNEKGMPKSSRDLSTAQFEDLMSTVRTWASAHGIFIEHPNGGC